VVRDAVFAPFRAAFEATCLGRLFAAVGTDDRARGCVLFGPGDGGGGQQAEGVDDAHSLCSPCGGSNVPILESIADPVRVLGAGIGARGRPGRRGPALPEAALCRYAFARPGARAGDPTRILREGGNKARDSTETNARLRPGAPQVRRFPPSPSVPLPKGEGSEEGAPSSPSPSGRGLG